MKRKDWEKYNKLKYTGLFPKSAYYKLCHELHKAGYEELNQKTSFKDFADDITNLWMPALVKDEHIDAVPII